MPTPAALLTLLALVTLILVARLIWRPEVSHEAWGRVLGFLALFILPAVLGLLAARTHLERSTSTEFCLSCHVMEPFGASLGADTGLAAAHYQNNRVAREQACYSCHTDYTMYGDLAAKWRGVRHVYVYYIGTTPEPEEIELYSPYENRECLHCHGGARSFEEVAIHGFGNMREALETNETSCLGCHGPAHVLGTVQEARGTDGQR
jgi:cytochrome c-type protein NapC